ncbi:MAG: seryl-tRNA synthetase [Candidatus Omnitrophota bacterium]|jgi:seryl-tRNA synthetase
MIDIKQLRENKDVVQQSMKARNESMDLDELLAMDTNYRSMLADLEALSQQKNQANTEIVELKKSGGDFEAKINEMKSVSQKIAKNRSIVEDLNKNIHNKLLHIPNILHKDTPIGNPPEANATIFESPKPTKPDFEYKTHVELGESLGILDFKNAAKLSGSSFILFRKDGARLERALINFMIDIHTQEHGYEEVSTPFIVKRQCMEGTGQLPKFESDMYRVFRGDVELEDGQARAEDFFLIPTAEVPVTNIMRNETLVDAQLPVAFVAYTPCFRLEAGAYGKDTKGMNRVHQFDKVELVRMCKPEDSENQHELLTQHAKTIFDKLGIPYRVLLLCSGDIGFSAAKCYDIEVWAPGAGQWLEASSCSNFYDFQSRRLNLKYKDSTNKVQLAHTLNGSGVALARTFIAVLENYQQADGSILIPDVLRPYMGGQERIERP